MVGVTTFVTAGTGITITIAGSQAIGGMGTPGESVDGTTTTDSIITHGIIGGGGLHGQSPLVGLRGRHRQQSGHNRFTMTTEPVAM